MTLFGGLGLNAKAWPKSMIFTYLGGPGLGAEAWQKSMIFAHFGGPGLGSEAWPKSVIFLAHFRSGGSGGRPSRLRLLKENLHFSSGL